MVTNCRDDALLHFPHLLACLFASVLPKDVILFVSFLLCTALQERVFCTYYVVTTG